MAFDLPDFRAESTSGTKLATPHPRATATVTVPPKAIREDRRPQPTAGRRSSLYERYGKRSLDIALGFLLLVPSIPLIAVMALAIAVTSGWPPFYVSERIGRNGRPFRMWKLRTMIVGADEMLEDWAVAGHPIAELHKDGLKSKDDPRETRLGRVLRRTSLDELPQLFNVLTGTMSLVGPRPYKIADLLVDPDSAQMILGKRPGMTGLWQTGPRNNVPLSKRVQLDVQYIQEISFLGDIVYLAKTVIPVVKRTGL